MLSNFPSALLFFIKPSLRELVQQTEEQSGIQVQFRIEGVEKSFSPDVGLLIYRIVQEAMRNIWKHSEAEHAEIHISSNREETTVIISDDGRGFVDSGNSQRLKAGKLGLMGMRERALLLGGKLIIRSAPQEGTKTTLTVPAGRQNKPV